MPDNARFKELRKVWKANGLCKLEMEATGVSYGKVSTSAILKYCPREDIGFRRGFNWTEPDGVTPLFIVSGE